MSSERNLETGKMDELVNGPNHMVAYCTYSGERVITTQWQQTTVMRDETIWWKCPACKDWHLTLMRRDEPVQNPSVTVIE